MATDVIDQRPADSSVAARQAAIEVYLECLSHPKGLDREPDRLRGALAVLGWDLDRARRDFEVLYSLRVTEANAATALQGQLQTIRAAATEAMSG